MNSWGLELGCIQDMQDRLSVYLGLSMLVTDADQNPITKMNNLNSFCEIINNTKKGKQACEEARKLSLKSVCGSGQPEIHRCHAGLAHIAVPVQVRGQFAAVVFGGGVALEALEDYHVDRLSAGLGLDTSELIRASKLVPVFTKEKMYMAMELYSSITGIISGLIRKTQDLKQVIDIGQLISSSLDLEKILKEAAESVSKILDIDGCFVRLLDEDSSLLQLKTSCSVKSFPPITNGNVFMEKRLLPPEVMESAMTVVTNEISTDARFAHIRSYYPKETKTAAMSPLSSGGKILGTMEVFSCCSHVWTEEEIGCLSVISAQTGLAVGKAKLYESIRTSYLSTTQALAAALEAKDTYTQGHSRRVAECAKAIAQELGLNPEEQEEVYMAGLLHDIGKIGVNEKILTKTGNLTITEKIFIQNHSLKGASILEQAKLPAWLIESVRYHHEDYNGNGYPDGIKGEQIPLNARIIRVADTYDAITSDRPYRKGYSSFSAIEQIRRYASFQFDPKVVKAFEKVMEDYKSLTTQIC